MGLIDQARGWQVPAGVVLADEAYGGSFEWRAALPQRGLFLLRAGALDDYRLDGRAALWSSCDLEPGTASAPSASALA